MSVPNKIVLKGAEAREKLIKGANFGADCVKASLGPFGDNALIEKGQRVTNDGVSIAKEIQLNDEVENLGWMRLRESSIRSNDEVGDGTTSAIILAQAILNEVKPLLSSNETAIGKKRPIEIINQLEKERKEIETILVSKSEPIKTKKDLINSAKVSVGDPELGDLIGNAQWELGKDGILMAEETAERKCSVEFFKGIKIDNGFSVSLVMNNQEKQTLEVENIPVLITNHTIKTLEPIFPVIEALYKRGITHLAIFARAWSSDGIKSCMAHNQKGFPIYPLNAPYADMKEIMQDMAAITGAEYIDEESKTLAQVMSSNLGMAEKIIASRYSATIIGKKDDKNVESLLNKRVKDLKDKLKGENSEFEKKNLNLRIAQMTNGFGIIKIGAISDTERKYKKDKADDAVNAVRVAWQEGVVPGAGLAFKDISDKLPDSYLLKRPLRAIYEQLMSTAPSDFKVEDWVKDPVKVLRIALANACSVAGTLASASIAIVTEKPKSIDKLLNKQPESTEPTQENYSM